MPNYPQLVLARPQGALLDNRVHVDHGVTVTANRTVPARSVALVDPGGNSRLRGWRKNMNLDRYTIIDARAEHVEAIAQRARQADVNECWWQTGMTLRAGLSLSIEHSTIARVGLADGVPAALYGVTDRGEDGGQVWMIGTTLLQIHRRVFMRISHDQVEEFRGRFHRLWNYVDATNLVAINWLICLGFLLYGPMPHGPFLRSFYFFDWQRQMTGLAAATRRN